MHVLIDGDIIGWRCGAVTNDAEEAVARWQADELLTRILEETNASSWKVYLSGDNNFRYQLYPDYKAHRRDKPRPKHLEAIREHILTSWPSEITDGYEADDALGIAATAAPAQTVIASIDKDLLQIPGSHYNFVKQEWSTITEQSGWYNFYIQLLVGDAADNIPGCPGIGKVKAPRLLEGSVTPFEMYHCCARAYTEAARGLDFMHLNAKLLYIWRKDDDEWQPPVQEPEHP